MTMRKQQFLTFTLLKSSAKDMFSKELFINGDPSNVRGFKSELADFKAYNYLDKWIVNMFALIVEKLGKEDENMVYYRINRNSI